MTEKTERKIRVIVEVEVEAGAEFLINIEQNVFILKLYYYFFDAVSAKCIRIEIIINVFL